jgi:hypothetical protein
VGCSAGAFIIGANLGQVDVPGIIALQLVAYFGGAGGPACSAARPAPPPLRQLATACSTGRVGLQLCWLL